MNKILHPHPSGPSRADIDKVTPEHRPYAVGFVKWWLYECDETVVSQSEFDAVYQWYLDRDNAPEITVAHRDPDNRAAAVTFSKWTWYNVGYTDLIHQTLDEWFDVMCGVDSPDPPDTPDTQAAHDRRVCIEFAEWMHCNVSNVSEFASVYDTYIASKKSTPPESVEVLD